MSDSAKIFIIGKSRDNLLTEIKSIRKWDNGHDYPIRVAIDENHSIYDTIDNLENVIKKGLLWKYIETEFNPKNQVIKTGGNDDLFLVPDPDKFNENNMFHKHRHIPTNFTPKKKKRKRK
jgi:hypothetical protein